MHSFIPDRRRCGGALLGALALLWGLLPGAARAQSAPWLVKDINPSKADGWGPNPESLIVAGKTAYFSAYDPRYGGELWKTDGTAPGTVMVKDIFPGMLSSWPQTLAAFGSTVYFSANDDVHGPELWKTDGTAAGTQLVKEIMPGFASPQAHDLNPVRGKILFTANDGPHGLELWRTDGTAAGTCMLKDFHPIHSGEPHGYAFLNDTAYFTVNETYYNADNTRSAVWKSDGSTAGTTRVLSSANGIGTMGAANGQLYLVSTSAEGGYYRMHFLSSNGTAAGTREFLSMPTNYGLTYSDPIAAPNGGACFVSLERTTTTLWLTDGTPQGTHALKKLVHPEPADWSLPEPKLWALNGALYFCAEDAAHGMELWKTNGTAAGTVLVRDIAPGITSADPAHLTIVGSRLYFTASDGAHGRELWRTDGTAAGTVMVRDIAPGSMSADPTQLTIVGSRLYFLAGDGAHGRELWRTDGSATGTVMVKDIIPSVMDYYYNPEYNTFIGNLRALNGRLLFTAWDSARGGMELWTSDGTAAGTHVLKDIIGAGGSAQIADPIACGGRAIYFTANDGAHGPELWKSDGRSVALVRDLRPGPLGGLATYYYDYVTCKVCINDAIYFSATDGLHRTGLYRCDSLTGRVTTIKVGMANLFMMAKCGNSLIFGHQGTPTSMDIWSTDGTATGLKLLKRFSPLPPNHYFYNPAPMPVVAELKGVVYFGAPGLSFPGLWKSDGTAAGTTLVSRMDSDPSTSYGGDAWPSMIKSAGDKLFMIANNKLWVSDGTAAGTRPVVRNKSSLTVSELETMAGKAWFRMSDPAYGDELWVSDGTEAGTRLVKDLWPGTFGSQPQYLLAVNGKLFFSAADPVHGVELWVSDGTAAGTRLVKDIAPGRTGAHPGSLTPFGARVLFSAYDPVHGNELWVSDGTAAGTVLAAEVVPGALGSNPSPIGTLGDTVLFSAMNGANPAQGYELWACKVGLPGTLRKWTRGGE